MYIYMMIQLGWGPRVLGPQLFFYFYGRVMKLLIIVPLIAVAMFMVLIFLPFFKVSGDEAEAEREWTEEKGDEYGV